MFLDKTLGLLASLMARRWPLMGVLLVMGVASWLCRTVGTRRRSHPWVVRKGVCPCCGSPLFGTTPAYQRLHGLDRVLPDSPWLCTTCDRPTIAAVQRHYHAEHAEE